MISESFRHLGSAVLLVHARFGIARLPLASAPGVSVFTNGFE